MAEPVNRQREVPAFYVTYFHQGNVYVSVDPESGAIGLHKNPHFATLFTLREEADSICHQIQRDIPVGRWASVMECAAADPRVFDSEWAAMDAWLGEQEKDNGNTDGESSDDAGNPSTEMGSGDPDKGVSDGTDIEE